MRPRIVIALFIVAASALPAAAQDGAALYKSSCAFCHDGGVPRAPNLEALRAMSPARILASMETGPMIAMADNRTVNERRAIAEFAAGKSFDFTFDRTPAAKAMCTASAKTAADPLAGPSWNGWGRDLVNTRFQDTADGGLRAADVPKLKVKWAFGFPGEVQSTAHATIAGGRVFV